jgi:hypothetical protein
MRYSLDINSDFKCLHCRSYVSSSALLAGVQNRNHCPYCLWSRHLDLFQAGDRLAACKAPMRPLGLALKHSRNKYAAAANGELMLVHLCVDCGRVSINRVAADDVPEAILEVFEACAGLPARTRSQLSDSGITLLGGQHSALVHRQLFGQVAKSDWAVVPIS